MLRWVASCLFVSRALFKEVREAGRDGCVVLGALVSADRSSDEWRRVSRSGLLWFDVSALLSRDGGQIEGYLLSWIISGNQYSSIAGVACCVDVDWVCGKGGC